MGFFRLTTVLGLLLSVSLAAGCGPDEAEVGDERRAEARGPAAVDRSEPESGPGADGIRGALRGVIRDARTDRPLADALVSAGALGTATDAGGGFLMPGLSPGPVKVRAYRRGFRPESTTVVVAAGETSVADLPLIPADPPCCTLEGEWSGRFELDSAGLNSRPAARRIEGDLTFGDPGDADAGSGARVASATGSSRLDFAPLLGTDVQGVVGDIEGMVFAGDSVAITLLPRFGDWAIELRGRQAADTLRGSWFQRASCCGAYGRFVLVRDDDGGAGRGS